MEILERKKFTAQERKFCVEAIYGQSHREKKYWCTYVYIYRGSKYFEYLNSLSPNDFTENVPEIPFHIGCTYDRKIYSKDGKCTCIQLGADYNHYYDQNITYLGEFREVEEDFKELYNFIKEKIENETEEEKEIIKEIEEKRKELKRLENMMLSAEKTED